MRPSQRIRSAALTVVVLASLPGCGPAGPKTYPVRGKVESTAGDVGPLAGCNVEAALESDPTVRASGVVQPDGSFTLQTLHAGVILKGAPAGSYRVRLILSDDGDRDAQRQRRAALHPRFLKFETSGLSLEVPTAGDVVLKVAPR